MGVMYVNHNRHIQHHQMRIPIFTFIVCIAFCSLFINAQAQITPFPFPNGALDSIVNSTLSPPKLGLTLSGGGVKGLAHIGVLRMIDSLDIHIDYLSATSMGSVVGALYAMGYSGDEIKRIALTKVDWSRMLTNPPPFDEVAFEEKDEFGRYAVELPIDGFLPTAPSAFTEGQYILALFNYYTYRARAIRDFSKLPISLRMMGSDIINGGSVRLDSGSLAIAMRASMAIPVVYTPIFFHDRLLVDGGLDKNFPVDEAISMGAVQVIGSYTGFRVYEKKEISSPTRLISQTYAFGSVKNARAQMKRTAVIINHTDGLRPYSTTDFLHYADIIRIGEEEARKMLPKLQHIAAEQHRKGIHNVRKLIDEPKLPIEKIEFLTAEDDPADPSVAQFAAARLGLETGKIYTAEQIREATKQLYGTRFFQNVYLAFDSTSLKVHLKDSESDHMKTAVYYDSYSSIGVILNYTARQMGFANSRLVLSTEISERLKVQGNYQFYLGDKYRFWVKPFFNYENIAGKEVLQQYPDNQNYNVERYDYGLGIGYSTRINSGFLFNFRRENDVLRRTRSLLTRFKEIPRNAYDHNSNVLQLNWTQNSFNDVFFPTKGSRTSIDIGWRFRNYFELNISPFENAVDSGAFQRIISPQEGQYVPKQVGKILIRHQTFVPIAPKVALTFGINVGSLWDPVGGDSLYLPNSVGKDFAHRYVFLNDRLYIGGSRLQQRNNRINFIGLRPGEVATYSNVSMFNIGVQYTPLRRIYLNPSVSYGFANLRGFNPFSGLLRSDLRMFGFGLKVGYQSPFGPVVITVENGNKLWRTFLSVGFPF